MSFKSSRAPRKSGRQSSSNAVVNQLQEWEVEKIVGKQFDESGNTYYQLKWKNWKGQPTWEPEENCDCEDLIKTYESKIAEKKLSRDSGLTSHSFRSNDSPSSTTSTSSNMSRGPSKMISRSKPSRVSVPKTTSRVTRRSRI